MSIDAKDTTGGRSMNRQCDATYSHAEWPLNGRCSSDAEKQAPSEGRAHDGGPHVYACATHAARNPWEKWEPVVTTEPRQ